MHGTQDKRAILADPRMGKSLAAAVAMIDNPTERTLVVSPRTVCPQWRDVLMAINGDWEVHKAYDISADKACQLLKAKPKGIVVLSDSILAPCVEAILKYKPQGAYVDESHRYAGVGTKRGRAMRRVVRQAEVARLLSGTPVPNHEGNLWGQMTALDPENWGTSFTKFADEYLVRDSSYPDKVLWVRNIPQLYNMLLQRASIYKREDEFGADDWEYVVRELELPPTARKLYDKLAKEWVLDDPNCNPANAGVRLMRLQQITAGFLPDAFTKEVKWLHEEKIDACLADLDEIVQSGKRAVVYYYFVEEGKKALDAIRNSFGKAADVFHIGKHTSLDERDRVFKYMDAGNRGLSTAICVVATDCGGIGRSLASADYSHFLSQNFSFVAYKQARDRMWEPSVGKVVTLYRFRRTVDMFVGKTLDKKGDIHEAVRNATLEEIVYGE